MMLLLLALQAAGSAVVTAGATTAIDTLRLEVGSPEVNGRIYAPHAARVRVHIGELNSPVTGQWTNELTVGDSAGRPVHRWVTLGTQYLPGGDSVTWALHQTFDAVTLAPLGYVFRSSRGAAVTLAIDGRRVRGTRQGPSDPDPRAVDMTIERPGFMAAASDLVPLAVGLREGLVLTAPVWSPSMAASEPRTFVVTGRGPVAVEGREWDAWRVEERRQDTGALVATWYLVEGSPYMVYGEVILGDGRIQRMTEVEIPRSR